MQISIVFVLTALLAVATGDWNAWSVDSSEESDGPAARAGRVLYANAWPSLDALYVNGKQVALPSSGNPFRFNAVALIDPVSCIAAKLSSKGFAFGALSGAWLIAFDNTNQLSTNSTWRCVKSVPAGSNWMAIGFDDSAWSPAKTQFSSVLGSSMAAKWGNSLRPNFNRAHLISARTSGARAAYCRLDIQSVTSVTATAPTTITTGTTVPTTTTTPFVPT